MEEQITLVIGLGEVGRPLFDVLRRSDQTVVGIDREPVRIERPVGVMHVCFPFVDAKKFRDAVISYIDQYRPEVVVINSTVLPGTTRELEELTGIKCVFSPVRGKHIRMASDLMSYGKFVAGIDGIAVERVQSQFSVAGMRTERMSVPESLELAKLLETTYFGLLIAWAQEMNRFSRTINADYYEIGKFFAEIPYLPKVLFQPGVIGGHCVMPNIELLQQRCNSVFLDIIVRSNELRKCELGDCYGEQGGRFDERLQPLGL